jgi:hypothetical protein
MLVLNDFDFLDSRLIRCVPNPGNICSKDLPLERVDPRAGGKFGLHSKGSGKMSVGGVTRTIR